MITKGCVGRVGVEKLAGEGVVLVVEVVKFLDVQYLRW